MVFRLDAHFTLRTYGVNQVFRFVEGTWLHRKSLQILFFFEKTYFKSYLRNLLWATFYKHDRRVEITLIVLGEQIKPCICFDLFIGQKFFIETLGICQGIFVLSKQCHYGAGTFFKFCVAWPIMPPPSLI